MVTKDFLDQALTIETLSKYRNKTNQSFEQKYIDWAYKNLIGLTRGPAMRIMTKKHNELLQEGKEDHDYTKRNEFVKVMHCVKYESEHGFEAGQEVEYWFSPHTKRVGIIQSIDKRQNMRIDEIIIPVDRIVSDKEIGQMELKI